MPDVQGQPTLALWRRLDAVHYLMLAEHGYADSAPLSTVFNPLAPVGFRVLDRLLPGPVDLGAAVFSMLSFAFALALLWRLCATYYGDARLGLWTVAVCAILPTAQAFSAPMSDSIYLALALAAFYAATTRHWALTGLFGLLATLARSQGVVLAVVAAYMLSAEARARSAAWPDRLRYMVVRGWPLAIIPLGFVLFLLYRDTLGLASIADVYSEKYHHYMISPLEGLVLNFRTLVTHPFGPHSIDLSLLVVYLGLIVVALRAPQHRRVPLLLYTVGHILVFVSKVNQFEDVVYTQGFARYVLALFPATILIAGWLRNAKDWKRKTFVAASLSGLLLFSAVHALGFGAVF
ncbi:MAG: hypothetical protein M5R40_16535 [Anaerolineae bacterium]|nr:hypothetical protein [Anaerolineae bacterium]